MNDAARVETPRWGVCFAASFNVEIALDCRKNPVILAPGFCGLRQINISSFRKLPKSRSETHRTNMWVTIRRSGAGTRSQTGSPGRGRRKRRAVWEMSPLEQCCGRLTG